MTNPIVVVNVTQQIGPTPDKLQRTGAFISQGATNLTQGVYSLLTQPADLTPLLAGSLALTSLTPTIVGGGTPYAYVTAVTAAPHGYTTGEVVSLTMAGATGTYASSFNGTYQCTITGASGFTYTTTGAVGAAPGTLVYTAEDVSELLGMTTTFFSQGASVAVYVLELGKGNATDGVNYLTSWINASSQFFYSYLVPRTWDGNAAFLSLIAANEATTSKTYFWVTTTLGTWSVYTALMKCVNAIIEAPAYGAWSANAITAASWSSTDNEIVFTTTTNHGVLPGQWFQISGMTPTTYNGWFLASADTGTTSLRTLVYTNPGSETVLGTLVANTNASTGIPALEFSQAAPYWRSLYYNPSSTNKVAPFGRQFVSGVTPFPSKGNAALLTTLKASNISVIGTGSQGGISNTLLLWGTMLDGRPFNYWYSADFAQINLALNVSNAVINGSNTPLNPLYNNQAGITALEGVCANTMTTMITVGLALGQVVQTALDGPSYAAALSAGTFAGKAAVNAVPFTAYYAINPGQYAQGVYNGLSVVYAPLRGFDSITINLVVTDFVAGP